MEKKHCYEALFDCQAEDEEELDHFANTHPEIRFIIAPHEIHEAHLKEIEKLFHRTVRYSVFFTRRGASHDKFSWCERIRRRNTKCADH